MSLVLDLTDRLRTTSRLIAESEHRLLESPGDFSTQLNLQSLEKHRKELEQKFSDAADAAGIDVCAYRLFGAGARRALSVFQALGSFQRLFSLTYRALSRGIKNTARLGEEDLKATAFGLSHTFAGSVGVVLTLPNERLLLTETEIDVAMSTVFTLAKLREPAQIKVVAASLGLPVIRELHAWGRAHTMADCGADIDWRRGAAVRASVFVQPQELDILVSAIDRTSDEATNQVTVSGELRGADVDPKRFHFVADDGFEYRGSYFDAIKGDRELALFKRYRATITRASVTHYATGEEDVTYFLDDLERLF